MHFRSPWLKQKTQRTEQAVCLALLLLVLGGHTWFAHPADGICPAKIAHTAFQQDLQLVTRRWNPALAPCWLVQH